MSAFFSGPPNGQKRWGEKKRRRGWRNRRTNGFGSQGHERGAECCCGRRRDGHLLGDPLSSLWRRHMIHLLHWTHITLQIHCHTDGSTWFMQLSVFVYIVHAYLYVSISQPCDLLNSLWLSISHYLHKEQFECLWVLACDLPLSSFFYKRWKGLIKEVFCLFILCLLYNSRAQTFRFHAVSPVNCSNRTGNSCSSMSNTKWSSGSL